MTPCIYLKIKKSPKYVGWIFWESDFANHHLNNIIIRKEIICQQDEPKLVGLLWTHLPSKTFLFFFARTKFLTIPKEI
jgi:hypothetical protein